MNVRALGSADAALVESFLAAHRDTSMFLRSNLRRAGFEDRGEPLQATYVGAFRGAELVGLAAHCWNGMLPLQAPEAFDEGRCRSGGARLAVRL
jgi:hypothetical protein